MKYTFATYVHYMGLIPRFCSLTTPIYEYDIRPLSLEDIKKGRGVACLFIWQMSPTSTSFRCNQYYLNHEGFRIRHITSRYEELDRRVDEWLSIVRAYMILEEYTIIDLEPSPGDIEMLNVALY